MKVQRMCFELVFGQMERHLIVEKERTVLLIDVVDRRRKGRLKKEKENLLMYEKRNDN